MHSTSYTAIEGASGADRSAAKSGINPMTSVQREAVDRALQEHANRPAELLAILHQVQAALGFVPTAATHAIATAINRSRAEVHGVLSFYHDFRQQPVAPHVIRVCRGEACQALGGDALFEHLRYRLDTDLHGCSSDGQFSFEPVYCLGNCACAPSIAIDGVPHGRVSAARADALLSTFEEDV